MNPKKRKKWLYILIAIVGLFVVGMIQKAFETPKPPPLKSTQTAKSESSGIVFTKEFISLNAVKKYPKLKTETEQLAYWYRYNVSAAAVYHKKPEKAGEYNKKFNAYKHVLGEKRFYEIMNLADSDYYNAK